ncbi:NFX1-type zinc finger-containing protein 1-like [Planococcus citri]|uniref:NFX1-type zinc finger-containing protein 1-like n=1 Tax=Planococcus citri TaxID=170843 RepID=UPI0031F8BB5D
MDKEKRNDDEGSNSPEEHTDVNNLNGVENQPTDSECNLNRNYQVQECSTSDCFRNKRSVVKDKNCNWRQISDQGDRNFSHDAFGKNEFGWRSRNVRDVKKLQRNKVEASSGNVSSVPNPLYPRSSSNRRSTHSGIDQTNWREKKPVVYEKPVKFQSSTINGNRLGHSDQPNDSNEDLNESRSNRGGNRNNSSWRAKPINREQLVGYKYLKALSEKEPYEMICEILRSQASITSVLKRKKLHADWMILIMETVRKLCDSDFKGNKIQVLQYFCESPLLDHVSQYLSEVGMEKSENTIKNLNSFVSDLISFYSAVINTIPTVAVDKNFSKFLIKTEMGVHLMKEYLRIEIDETNVEKLAILKKILEDETKICEKTMLQEPRKKYLELRDVPPPDNFRGLSLYPTQEDLSRHDFGFIRPNKIRGAYDNVHHYLDVQFRLIREDFIGPLRSGLHSYKHAIALQSKPKYKYESLRFYPDVQIKGIEISNRNQVAYAIHFNSRKRFKNINWTNSKWFMFGSLLLFTRDNFESFFFATVLNRDLHNLIRGRILVTFVGDVPLEKMLNQSFLMVESDVYFEPYCLVMKAMKDYSEYNFPMKQFIIDGNTEIDLPRYIEESDNDLLIYNHYVNPVRDNWPLHSIIGFDEHQFEAFKTALTSNFTVIQGPPGTGKTYLGLKIVQVLLDNIKYNRCVFRTPILLVCYTNHALDQFLEGILNFTEKIVRVGGQSKSELLKPFNLRSKGHLDGRRREAKEMIPTLKYCREQMHLIWFELMKMTAEKKIIESAEGILSYYTLKSVMKPEFQQMIYDDDILLEWLLPSDNNDLSIPESNLEMKNAKNVGLDSTESVEIDHEFHFEEDNDTMEADPLVDEDDVFDMQVIHPYDLTVGYCISIQSLVGSLQEMRSMLIYLENNKDRSSDDYIEYHNYKYQLLEDFKNTQLLYRVLGYYLQSAELHSSMKYNSNDLNLWEISINQRWKIYWSWVSQLKKNFERKLANLEAHYRLLAEQYAELKQLEDFYVVRESLVVGMTTTCAARLQLLLQTLKPAIVIVEEAAEVLEAHIVVSLGKNCEHVILIGDHKQLKPSAAVYELSKKYNINVSLFERMINNHMYCPQLQIQHRMRPEISSLIVPAIYPNLKNHESVFEYPSVRGITKNLFFIEHNNFEEEVDNSSSRKNQFEADFMIQLCRYIILQGYSEDQVTILTTYTGQMFLLREMKNRDAFLRSVKVVVVDKYQGEENDIILLSLVRSNEERKIGFLNIENRVCVALSRAKIGLYMIGNMDILSDCNLWKNIKEELVKQEAIGSKMTLHCDEHDVYTQVSCKEDFVHVKEGGCHNLCQKIMDCGHECKRLCHKLDVEHLAKKCYEKCSRNILQAFENIREYSQIMRIENILGPTLIRNHPCEKYCYEDCGQCTVPVEEILPCGHSFTLRCFEDPLQYSCQVELSVLLESCSHEVKKKCYQSMEDVECTFPCEDRLECGHQCRKNCHKTEDPDHLEYKCYKACDKMYRGCSKEHKCEKLCFEDCGKCEVPVDFTLKCGHAIELPCSADLDEVKCRRLCNKECCECNGICQKQCFEDCKPCKNKVTKRVPDCDHEIILECSVVPERKLCQKLCQRVAPCGHKCKSVCGKQCGSDPCMEKVESTHIRALCGHGYADVPCCRRNEEAIQAEEFLPYCAEPCLALLKCGDLCAGTCGSCWQGRLHETCKNERDNVLICDHSCTFPCRKVCPPCIKPCQYSCKHSKCSNHCGLPCDHCKKNCEWKCVHMECTKKCGDFCNREPCYEPCPKKLECNHDCIGFCGEPCPDKCRICNKDDVTAIVFGDEDKEDARFVLLVDCGHYVESKAMDRYISLPSEKGEIVMKVCPVCKTPILTTLRYMNQVKKFFRDIQNVKKKICGNYIEMKEIRAQLAQQLQKFNSWSYQLFCKEMHSVSQTALAFKTRLEIHGKNSYLSSRALRSMQFFTDMFSSIVSRMNELKNCAKNEQSRILKNVEFILKRVNPEALLLNVQQVDDIRKELNRYHRMVDYCVFLNKPEYRNNQNLQNVTSIIADIGRILYGLKCFDDELNVQIGELFEKLQKDLNCTLPLSPKDMRILHTKMAKNFYGGVNIQSRWFICTKGHYYCVADFGESMEESKCPECSEKIGIKKYLVFGDGRPVRVLKNVNNVSNRKKSYFNFRGFRRG